MFFNSMVSGKMQLFISESGESIKNSPMDYYVGKFSVVRCVCICVVRFLHNSTL